MSLESFFEGKEILITGGTGSLGNALARRLVALPIRGLRIFSRDELKQWEMGQRFADAPRRISYLLGDVRDLKRLERACRGVDLVIHCAALKQVPAAEINPGEAIDTNIHGARNVLDAAINCGVRQVLNISTDKAVYPINLYGMTKGCAERLMIDANVFSPNGTAFNCCRYGNVIGSRGSILPLFAEQIKSGVVTLTDPAMTRFWISLEEVAEFILRRAAEVEEKKLRGHIFIPKMPSVKIAHLIDVMVARAGKKAQGIEESIARIEERAARVLPTCKVKITGVRPGEKIHEALITREERYEEELGHYDVSPAGRFEGEFTSDKNIRWLSDSEIESILEANKL